LPGDRIDSESRLAGRLGVSATVLREALSTLEREGLIERRQGSGTYVSDTRLRKHAAILIELDISDPATSWFHFCVVQRLREFFAESGVRSRLYVGHVRKGEQPKGLTCAEFLEDLEADRILCVAAVATIGFRAFLDELARRGIPVVGGVPQFPHGVEVDHGGMVAQAVRIAAQAGRRRIACMESSRFLYPEFAEALASLGLPDEPRWQRSFVPGYETGAAYEAFLSMWNASDDRKPDALVIADDSLFAECATAIVEAGIRVPDDLLVITQANKGAEMHATFPFVRIETDGEEYAKRVGRNLLRLLAGDRDVPARDVIGFRVLRVEPCGGARAVVRHEAVAASSPE
jgi:DNA-binding LacI/PurR family transcriptional regulator